MRSFNAARQPKICFALTRKTVAFQFPLKDDALKIHRLALALVMLTCEFQSHRSIALLFRSFHRSFI